MFPTRKFSSEPVRNPKKLTVHITLVPFVTSEINVVFTFSSFEQKAVGNSWIVVYMFDWRLTFQGCGEPKREGWVGGSWLEALNIMT